MVVFGQYRTGTTALFYRIKNSLSGEVRTLFEVVDYAEEPDDARRDVLAKVILRTPETPDPRGATRYERFMGFDKQLYLVRDPRDWLVSGLLFAIQQEPRVYNDAAALGRIVALLSQKERDPRSISLLKILDAILLSPSRNSLDSVTAWMRRQHEWLAAFEDGLRGHYRITYEDLVDGKLRGLEAYLGFALTGSDDVTAEHDHVPRTKRYGNWRDWFLEEDVAHFRRVFEAYLHRHGYPEEWRLNTAPVIRPEHCTQYVARVVEKRRQAARQSSADP
jgi:hypothetical protein